MGKTKWSHEGCEMAKCSVGAWRETVGTEDERNARDDRELAPKGDMENDRREWK